MPPETVGKRGAAPETGLFSPDCPTGQNRAPPVTVMESVMEKQPISREGFDKLKEEIRKLEQ
ncbi:MAG: hypothetical protein KDA79_18885, partial [Planctomycetaceae bacterium]|nr:hypothetical protein [Planctomycetaceae bacterium]